MQKIKSTKIRLILVLCCVYFFLLSIAIMESAFKGFGRPFAEALINTTSNPFISLFIGIFATSLVQSSSTTTSIVVGMVASGVLSVGGAIPLVMGANIGTAVTNTLVSFGHMTRRDEFRRAISGATLHDFFNVCCVAVMFPLELATGFLQRSATFLAESFMNVGGLKFTSPIKMVTKPLVSAIKALFLDGMHLAPIVCYVTMLLLAAVILFAALYFIVKLMKSLVMSKADDIIDRTIGKHAFFGIFVGFVFTVIVQSSSITTSLLVPLVGAGILTLPAIFPIVLGANIGTTTTAILASFATGNVSAITVSFVHFLFNVCGTLLIYPIPLFRKIPFVLSHMIGELAYKKRRYAVMYLLGMYFIIPGIFIFISKLIAK